MRMIGRDAKKGTRRLLISLSVIMGTAVLVVLSIFTQPSQAQSTAGKIVFISNRSGPFYYPDIYVMNPDGSNVKQLTFQSNTVLEPVRFPSFSRDGKKIVFVRGNHIWIMNADGTNQTQLTHILPGIDTDPSFSPDGTKIVFHTNRHSLSGSSQDNEIYVMNADGTNQKRLTNNSHINDSDPSFSPDGTRIVFRSLRNAFINSEIYVMNADGSNVQQLTSNMNPINPRESFQPTYSPDGTRIAFVSALDTERGNNEIYIMNADGTNQKRLTNNPRVDFAPGFSPDGTSIVFTSDRDGTGVEGTNYEIYVMSIDGTNQRNITKDQGIRAYPGNGDTDPSWAVAATLPPTPTPTPNTPPGNNVTAQTSSGNARVTFSQVTAAGSTTFAPINPPSAAGSPPQGYTIQGNATAFNITSTASYTPPLTVCLTASAISDPAEFARLRVLHGENGQLVDRTILSPGTPAPDFATRRICARVNSLSPFVTALASPTPTPSPTPSPVPRLVGLGNPNYTIREDAANTAQGFGSLTINVIRTGDTSAEATVEYFTTDQNGGAECNQVTGQASQRCDYTLVNGTLRFGAGQSTKSITIPIINDGYVEGAEFFSIQIVNPVGAALGTTSQATITIEDNDTVTSTASQNPYLNNRFFVRLNYLDFLGREPDAGGWTTWPTVLNNCGSQKGFLGAPPDCDRAHVSHGFFGSPEFTDTGFLIYRLYEVGMGRLPRYLEFTPDMASLSGFGLTDAVKQQNLNNYLQQFTAKGEFQTRFAGTLLTSQAAALIQKLEQTAGVTLPSTATTLPGQPPQYGRQELIIKRQTGQLTLGQTVKAFVEQKIVYDKYFPRGEVTMMYFAYLRRDPGLNDPNLNGWTEWVFVFTNGGAARGRPDIQPRDIHHLIFGFIYSEEYRKRFGQP